jgi:peptidoglycan-associated lipoprotein
MHKHWLQVLALVFAASLLGGCGGKTKSDAESSSDNAGLTDEELAARTQGTADSSGLEGSAMDDGTGGSDLTPAASGNIIYFDYDSSEIREEYRGIVEAAVAHITSDPNAVVTLEGHTDERGSREYNLALGERRAQAVSRQMTLLGASANQIRTSSYGEERPQDPGHDEAAYGQNRRVEVRY